MGWTGGPAQSNCLTYGIVQDSLEKFVVTQLLKRSPVMKSESASVMTFHFASWQLIPFKIHCHVISPSTRSSLIDRACWLSYLMTLFQRQRRRWFDSGRTWRDVAVVYFKMFVWSHQRNTVNSSKCGTPAEIHSRLESMEPYFHSPNMS